MQRGKKILTLFTMSNLYYTSHSIFHPLLQRNICKSRIKRCFLSRIKYKIKIARIVKHKNKRQNITENLHLT